MSRAEALLRPARASTIRWRARRWPDRSRLFVLGDDLGWSLDDDAAYISSVAREAGYVLGPPGWARPARRQVVFLTSHFAALDPHWAYSAGFGLHLPFLSVSGAIVLSTYQGLSLASANQRDIGAALGGLAYQFVRGEQPAVEPL